MSIVIIEFYDSGVRISDGKNILANSDSCALVESNNSIFVGDHAVQQAHLRPRESNRLFWGELSKKSHTKHIISNAEIALCHLRSLWDKANCKEKDTILVTPSTLDKHDLSLLLGICNKVSIKVTGIVCNAALAMQQPVNNCKAIYIDLLQKKLSITEIIQSDKGISLKQPCHILNFGVRDFIQSCAKNIANAFVYETRFDPLFSAKDEQQFFNNLPLWLDTLKNEREIECKLCSEDKSYSTIIKNENVYEANKLYFEKITAYLKVLFHGYDRLAIYCSATCKNIFGMEEFLTAIPGSAIIQLNETDLVSSAYHHKDHISGEQVHFINSIPWNRGAKSKQLTFNPGKLSNLANMPTHIVINNYAYDLHNSVYLSINTTTSEVNVAFNKTPESFCKISNNKLKVQIQTLNNKSVKLNQQKIEQTTAVNIGDNLTIDSSASNFSFIKVVKNEA